MEEDLAVLRLDRGTHEIAMAHRDAAGQDDRVGVFDRGGERPLESLELVGDMLEPRHFEP